MEQLKWQNIFSNDETPKHSVDEEKELKSKFTTNLLSTNSSTVASNSESFLYTIDSTKNTEALNIEANIPAFDKEKSHQYSLISYLTSKKKPDVYHGDLVLKARNYKISMNNTPKLHSETKLGEKLKKDAIPADSSSEDALSESSVDNYEKMKKKDLRYYAISNITMKCYNCNEVGHMSRNCPNDFIINCTRCNGKGHDDYSCPNVKCFKCNRIGHKSFECKVSSKDIIKCEKCKNVGHESSDCLISPDIRRKEVKNLICYFCGKTGHLICPIGNDIHIIEDYLSDHVVMSESESEAYKSDEDFLNIIRKTKRETPLSVAANVDIDVDAQTLLKKKKKRRIFNAVRNGDLKRTVFCPKCGGLHKFSTCTVQTRYNSFDQLRQSYSKSLFKEDDRSERRYKPTAYEDRKHKTEKKDKYNDADFSSDEAFEDTLKRNNKRKDYSYNKHGKDVSDSGSDRRKKEFKYSSYVDSHISKRGNDYNSTSNKSRYNEPYNINKDKYNKKSRDDGNGYKKRRQDDDVINIERGNWARWINEELNYYD